MKPIEFPQVNATFAEVVASLNRYHAIDPTSIEALVRLRVLTTNRAFIEDSTIEISASVLGNGQAAYYGVIGLINGLLVAANPESKDRVAVVFGSHGSISGFTVIQI